MFRLSAITRSRDARGGDGDEPALLEQVQVGADWIRARAVRVTWESEVIANRGSDADFGARRSRRRPCRRPTGRMADTRSKERAGRRAATMAIRDWRRGRIREAARLRHQLAQFEALALGTRTARPDTHEHRHLDIDIAAVGARRLCAFQSVIVTTPTALAEVYHPTRRSIGSTLQEVLNALDHQEETLLQGREPARIDPSAAPDLFSPETLAARFDLPWRLPSIAALLARPIVDAIRWLGHRSRERRRAIRGDQPSDARHTRATRGAPGRAQKAS